MLLTNEFLRPYKEKANPFPNPLGEFVYYRTYSRYLAEEGRREKWWETVRRVVEYNCSLDPNVTSREAEKMFDFIYNLKLFPSGRTLWVGGEEVSKQVKTANFNCSFNIIDNLKAFYDTFYLLMVGAGVGARILKSDVEKLPRLRPDFSVHMKPYEPVAKEERLEETHIENIGNTWYIVVGDSKQGWASALQNFLEILSSDKRTEHLHIKFDFDNVRPKGEVLKTFGGYASGHESLQTMFEKIAVVIQNSGTGRLRPIHCLDILCIIGENVVAGGTRRTSIITLIDEDDVECIQAKNGLYDSQGRLNKAIAHRRTSNNSILYFKKPSMEQLKWQIEQMRYTGEPAFVNMEAGRKRRPDMEGVNPCAEILLKDKEMCNLTTVNVIGFIKDGELDWDGLMEAQELSARMGLRMSTLDLELDGWNDKSEYILGCSLTGWEDAMNALDYDPLSRRILHNSLREKGHEVTFYYARQLRITPPNFVTTLKPEGTISLLPTVSSGMHFSHAPYYIRRVRISKDNPLSQAVRTMGFMVEDDQSDANLDVFSFPVKAPEGKTKDDVSALEQLKLYKNVMKNYVDFNASNTIHVRPDEWEDVTNWMYTNWDEVVAVSFLPLDDSVYPQMPLEAITEEEYLEMLKQQPKFDPELITQFEQDDIEMDLEDDPDCATGICPIK